MEEIVNPPGGRSLLDWVRPLSPCGRLVLAKRSPTRKDSCISLRRALKPPGFTEQIQNTAGATQFRRPVPSYPLAHTSHRCVIDSTLPQLSVAASSSR